MATLSPILSTVISAGKFGRALCEGGCRFCGLFSLKYHTRPIYRYHRYRIPTSCSYINDFSSPPAPFRVTALRLVSGYLAMIPGACVTVLQVCRRKRVRRSRNVSAHLIKNEYKANTYPIFKIRVFDSRLSFLSLCLSSITSIRVIYARHTNNYISNCPRLVVTCVFIF